MSTEDRIEAIGASGIDERALRIATLDLIAMQVPFDHHVWLVTDPDSCVGCLPLADVPDLRDVPRTAVVARATGAV